jgi:hypothetical protein
MVSVRTNYRTVLSLFLHVNDEHLRTFIIFEVFAAVKIHIAVSCVMAPFSLEGGYLSTRCLNQEADSTGPKRIVCCTIKHPCDKDFIKIYTRVTCL